MTLCPSFSVFFLLWWARDAILQSANKKEECCDSRQFGKYEMPPKKTSLSLYIFWGAAAAISFARNNGWHSGIGGGGGKFSLSYQQQNSQTFFLARIPVSPQKPNVLLSLSYSRGKTGGVGNKYFSRSRKNKFQLIVYAKSSSSSEENSVAVSQRLSVSFVTATWERPGEKNLLAWSKTNAIFLLFPTTQLIIISGKSLSPFK